MTIITLQNIYKTLCNATDEQSARYIIERETALGWSDLIANPETPLSQKQKSQINARLKRHLSGEPLSRIYAEREFYGLSFFLSEETLDPRPDTEILIDKALEHFKSAPPQWILDIGTGTGCIPITLLKHWPDARAIATDLSRGALCTAQKNAIRHNIQDRIFFVKTHWAEGINQQFDCVVSNPPYIRTDVIPNLGENVQNYDPILALDGGKDGVQAYKDIFLSLPNLLKATGRAFFEIGYDQKNEIERLSKNYRIRIEAIHADCQGNPRVVDISCGDK